MSEQIVSCPGCNKRYAVPGGAPPGQFQCEDCSAVVPYGPSPTAKAPNVAAHSRTARSGGGGGGGRRRRKGGRRREREEIIEDDGAGRRRGGGRARKEKDPTPIVLGIIAVGLIAVIGVMLVNRGGDEKGTETADGKGGRTSSASGLSSGDLPDSLPDSDGPSEVGGGSLMDPLGTARTGVGVDTGLGPGAVSRSARNKKDEGPQFKMAEVLPTGGNYGKGADELATMLRKDRSSVVQPLDHLPDTPEDVRAEIDRLVAVMADPDAGREALDAQRALVKIGRAAVPKILTAAGKFDFDKYDSMMDAVDACIVADAVDHAMRDITSKTNFTRLQFNPQGKLRVYTVVIQLWYRWWLNTGYEYAEFPKPKEEIDEDEEL